MEKKDIEKRIKELETEIKNETEKFNQHGEVRIQLQTSIIAKQGAVEELKKLK